MSKTLKWIIFSLIAVIILLVIFKKTGVLGKEEGVKISTEKVTKRTIIETVNASGKVYPVVEVKMSPDISGEIVELNVAEGDSVVEVKMSPDISGEIVELNVAEGDSVKKGQVLARIYADIYQTQRDQASAMVSQ